MTRLRLRPFVVFLTLFAGAMMLVAASAASAATRGPATFGGISAGNPGTADGGVYQFDVGFAGPDDPAAGFVAGRKTGHCIQNGVPEAPTTNATLRTGVQASDLTLPGGSLAAAPGGPDRLKWILLSSRRFSTTPSEGAAHQVAVWLLTAGNGSAPVNPAAINDPSVLTRANQLLAESATYAAAAAAAPALSALGAEVCGQLVRTIRVNGAPNTDVSLSIVQGQAQFPGGGQQTVVTLGNDGVADVQVTALAFGAVQVQATASIQTLVQVDNGQSQDFAYLESRPVTLNLTLNFTPCPTPTPAGPTPTAPAPTVVGVSTSRLAVLKFGPRFARAGSVVTYRVRVRNTSTVAATNVRLTDIIPRGFSVVSRPGKSRLRGRTISWTVGTLAPGQARTYTIRLRAGRGLRDRRCNDVRARAGNAAVVGARVCTSLIPSGQTRVPAVTG